MTAVNPLRGEAVVAIAGLDYKIVLDVNSFCSAQTELSMKPLEITAAIAGDPDDLVTIRGLFWAGLQKHHPCHLLEAGEIMADADQSSVRNALLACLAAAFGLKEPGEDAGEDKKPGKVETILGTGQDSTGSIAKPAATAKRSGKKPRA